MKNVSLKKWHNRGIYIKSDLLVYSSRGESSMVFGSVCIVLFIFYVVFLGIQSCCDQWAAPPSFPVSAQASDGRHPGSPL